MVQVIENFRNIKPLSGHTSAGNTNAGSGIVVPNESNGTSANGAPTSSNK